jgi:cation:H+ antiporter
MSPHHRKFNYGSPPLRTTRLSASSYGLITPVKPLMPWIESAGLATPWFFVGVFLAASFLMIWRLESMAADGMEGTVLGTLITPYCTGMGNLVFAIVLGMRGGSGAEVVTNCLVNNVTNLTLLVGLPAALWGLSVIPEKTAKNDFHRRNRLSMLLTLFAVLFFTGMTWVLGGRREIGFAGGLVLVGLFLCWQAFHVFEVFKSNARRNMSFGRMLPVDLMLLAIGAYGTYLSTDWLVGWVSRRDSSAPNTWAG